jgi:hypothetical protein
MNLYLRVLVVRTSSKLEIEGGSGSGFRPDDRSKGDHREKTEGTIVVGETAVIPFSLL